MAASACVSAVDGFDSSFFPLVLSALLTSAVGAFPMIFVTGKNEINMRESYVIVVGSWLLVCIFGMFPYMLWGGEFALSSAWFESVSGFSTTGSTALADVEALPRGLLFWRSSTHFMGGVGVVMFALLILPSIGRAKSSLSSGEISSLARDNFRYRAHKIVQILLFVYIGMTLTQTILLNIAGLGWFDAVNTAFSTIATGGFSVKNASIGAYDNMWVNLIVTLFMLMGGLHFGLIFSTLTGKSKNIFNTEVSRFYLISVAVATMAVAASLTVNKIYPDFWQSVQHSLFQVVAYASTTGFATADANLWGSLPMIIMVFLSIQCACAGSTSGGMKADRVWLAIKAVRAGIMRQRHPNAVVRIKIDNVVQEDSAVSAVLLYIFIYLATVLAGTIIVSAAGVDATTAFTGSIASMGNVGPGFGQVGSMETYAGMSPFVKVVFTMLMLLGRLEIFGLIQLFTLKWWRR